MKVLVTGSSGHLGEGLVRHLEQIRMEPLGLDVKPWAGSLNTIFKQAIRSLLDGRDYRSPLARQVGRKSYHDAIFDDGPYPVEETLTVEKGHDR